MVKPLIKMELTVKIAFKEHISLKNLRIACLVLKDIIKTKLVKIIVKSVNIINIKIKRVNQNVLIVLKDKCMMTN
jgi:hypothetical protein